MKLAAKSLALLFTLAATLAHTQTLPHFQHIIILFQENRTPDNLFGGNPTFEPGVDLQQSQLGQPWCLGACFDPNHGHPSFESIWNPGSGQAPMCNGGKSSCTNTVVSCPLTGPLYSTCNGQLITQTPNNAQETYVSPTYDNNVMLPYFEVAQNYGFANYMFQTNEGPSNLAHQFIFSGTSAVTGDPTQQYYQDFAAENPADSKNTGCAGDPNNTIFQINSNGQESNQQGGPPKITPPCFEHPTLASLLDSNKVSWRYYADRHDPAGNSIWTAPNSIQDICAPISKGSGQCNGPEWVDNVELNSQKILSDLEPPVNGNPGCDLRAVSWVIPWGDRSDHPGMQEGQASTDIEHGPSWVAAVINSVGNTTCTDTINGKQVPYWQDTAIFVTWDDWGGFWDHINPDSSAGGPGVLYNATGHPCSGFGCGYIYGFRVPLLVVSAYTPAGYVSGDTRTHGETFPYIHDFGSILAFIENNFLGSGAIGQINPQYKFADAFAPDGVRDNIPLADFFTLTMPRQFQSIVLPSAWQGYDANYFLNYSGPIMDPDNDAIDND